MKYIYILIFLLFTSPSHAGLDIPSPEGRGTYAELGEDNGLTGDNNFSGTIRGTALYDYLGAGQKHRENYVHFSETFDETAAWILNNTTATDVGNFYRLEQSVAGLNVINQRYASSGSSGKTLCVNVTVKPTTTNGLNVALSGYDGSTFTGTYELLPVDRWTTLHYETTTTGNFKISITNKDSVADFDIDVAKIAVHEKIKPALYSNGDSIGRRAYTPVLGASAAHCYTSLYAKNNNIDFVNNSTDTETLAEISARVITDLAVKKYDVIILEGGANDIDGGGAGIATTMYYATTAMVNAAKLSSSKIILLTSPSCPAYTSTEQGYNDTYNGSIKSLYKYDTFVTVIDLDEILDPATDFYIYGIHPTMAGHLKIYNAIEEVMPLPPYAETYDEVETTVTITVDSNDDIFSKKKYIDWTTTRTISDNATADIYDYRIFIDTTTAGDDVILTIPLGSTVPRGQYMLFNTGSNDVIVTPTTDTVDNSTTKTFSEGALMITYDGVSDWR